MFLANENFPRPSTVWLREAGIIVRSIQEDFPSISDKQVLQKAINDSLIILTFDRDYGELIFRHQTKNPPAVIFFWKRVLILYLQEKFCLLLYKRTNWN
jgi:predicted nuclease of predicted toxin-antitoxin system